MLVGSVAGAAGPGSKGRPPPPPGGTTAALAREWNGKQHTSSPRPARAGAHDAGCTGRAIRVNENR